MWSLPCGICRKRPTPTAAAPCTVLHVLRAVWVCVCVWCVYTVRGLGRSPRGTYIRPARVRFAFTGRRFRGSRVWGPLTFDHGTPSVDLLGGTQDAFFPFRRRHIMIVYRMYIIWERMHTHYCSSFVENTQKQFDRLLFLMIRLHATCVWFCLFRVSA